MDTIDALLRCLMDLRLRVVNGHSLTRDDEDRLLYKIEELKSMIRDLYERH